MRIYRVKLTLVFKDGINKGTLKVKAISATEAVGEAVERMLKIWTEVKFIQIQGVK